MESDASFRQLGRARIKAFIALVIGVCCIQAVILYRSSMVEDNTVRLEATDAEVRNLNTKLDVINVQQSAILKNQELIINRQLTTIRGLNTLLSPTVRLIEPTTSPSH